MNDPLPWLAPVKARVAQGLEDGRIHHAWLVHGAPGLGKRAYGHELANELLCEKRSASGACGHCTSCTLVGSGNHPDFLLISPQEGKSTISVDQIRDLSKTMALKSHQGARKVVLLYPAEAMTINAANSLLKTLEEPQGDAVLLLITDRPGRLPATITSRCQTLSVPTPNKTIATQWLEGQEPKVHWHTPLALAGGAPLLALEWHRAGRLDGSDELMAQLVDICRGRCAPATVARQWQNEGPWFLVWLQAWTRDVIKIKSGAFQEGLVLQGLSQDLQHVSKNIKLQALFDYLDELNVATGSFDGPLNKQLLLESLLIPWQNGLITRGQQRRP